ncbi:MAG: hypothetical protein FJ090_19620 [Deltaproteobacteria bacterium]|nr:hypothetical protein [Deltaproteobacteria bacterium]
MVLALAACSGKSARDLAVPAGPSDGSNGDGAAAANAGSAAATATPPAVTITDTASATANAGKTVTVAGTARNAKLAAAVVGNGLVVYCLGTDSWPTPLTNKPIAARGVIEQTTEFAAGPDEAGTTGAVWVLRGCQYETP